MAKPFIGIKQIFYGNPITSAVTPTTLAAWLKTATEVKNSHDGTWSYTQDDPETTEYRNELSGQNYFVDKTSNGAKTIAFSIGVYAFSDKAALQGGEVIMDSEKEIGWKAPQTLTTIEKAIVGVTKTGNYVVFTNANIIGKADTQEKNLALGVTAKALDNTNPAVADEYWFDAEAMEAAISA